MASLAGSLCLGLYNELLRRLGGLVGRMAVGAVGSAGIDGLPTGEKDMEMVVEILARYGFLVTFDTGVVTELRGFAHR